MRLSKIRGSLSYYSERELSDESGDVLCLAYGRAGDRVQANSVGVEALLDSTLGIRYPIKALDITVAAPKAVSIQWALASDSQRQDIERAHHDAVARTLTLMLWVDAAKVGSDGGLRPIEGVRAFDVGHKLSRAGDPHLHSHVIIPNVGEAGGHRVALEHGRWQRGLAVYELAYRSELAAGLASLGLQLIGRGLEPWHIVGQHPGLNEVFSKRRREVLALSTETASSRARQLAAITTRQPKTIHVETELRKQWEAEARANSRERSPAMATKDARVRVNDPLLNEVASAIEEGAVGISAATKIAFGRALGADRARELILGQAVDLGGAKVSLDGTLCQAYRSLSVRERLGLMETPMANLEVVRAPREVTAMVRELEANGLKARTPVHVATRTVQEEALVVGFSQYRRSTIGPTLVVDANVCSPSELATLVARSRTIVRENGLGTQTAGSTMLMGMQDDQGRALVVAESAIAVWHAFVDDCHRWVQAGCGEQVRFATPSPGLTAKLRREVAERSPDAVAGFLGAMPLFDGEPVRLDDGRHGALRGIQGGELVVDIEGTRESVSVSTMRLASFGSQMMGNDVVRYGPSWEGNHEAKRAYICEAGVNELVRSLDLNVDGRGVCWVREGAVRSISTARMRELERTNGRFVGQELYRLRAITTVLSRVYDSAAELGLDERHGRDRIIDERLGLSREMTGRQRARQL